MWAFAVTWCECDGVRCGRLDHAGWGGIRHLSQTDGIDAFDQYIKNGKSESEGEREGEGGRGGGGEGEREEKKGRERERGFEV